MISIVIPHYNHEELTNRLVDSLLKLYGNPEEVEIVVIDNGSAEEYKHEGIKIARVSDNMGFLFATRLGLYTATGKIRILLSNDVEVSGDFLALIEAKLTDLPNALIGNRLLDQDTGWNTIDGKIYPYLEGWFLAARWQTWQDLGDGFDIRYAPNDFEDVDLSTTALSLGYPVVSLDTPFLRHLGAQTLGYNPEREAQTRKNQQKFIEKWTTK